MWLHPNSTHKTSHFYAQHTQLKKKTRMNELAFWIFAPNWTGKLALNLSNWSHRTQRNTACSYVRATSTHTTMGTVEHSTAQRERERETRIVHSHTDTCVRTRTIRHTVETQKPEQNAYSKWFERTNRAVSVFFVRCCLFFKLNGQKKNCDRDEDDDEMDVISLLSSLWSCFPPPNQPC